MAGTVGPKIPLSRNRTHRVRSAVIQAISLAHLALTCVRGCVHHLANLPNSAAVLDVTSSQHQSALNWC
jgi:hypothetical protein